MMSKVLGRRGRTAAGNNGTGEPAARSTFEDATHRPWAAKETEETAQSCQGEEDAMPAPSTDATTSRPAVKDEAPKRRLSFSATPTTKVGSTPLPPPSPPPASPQHPRLHPGRALSTNGVGAEKKEKKKKLPEPEGTGTFRYQPLLPKLPIPDLAETVEAFLTRAGPLLSPEELVEERKICEEWARGNGVELQRALAEYNQDKSSYIEDFWFDSYLNTEGSVVLNLNPFFILEDDPTPSRNNQIARASSLVLSSLKFIGAVRREQLEPDIWRGTPLCMEQFRHMFGSARVPSVGRDTMTHYADSQHIVVIARGQYYYFDVITRSGSLAVTEQQISTNLRAIINDADAHPEVERAAAAIGVLTASDRAVWAEVRERVAATSENNRSMLEMMDSALLCVCLDDISPSSTAEMAENVLHGTCQMRGTSGHQVQVGTLLNRWYDKTQIVVCENGQAGVNFEHSGTDGHTVLRFVSDVFTDTILRFAQSIHGMVPSIFTPPVTSGDESDGPEADTTPRKLEWELDHDVYRHIRFAETKLSDLVVQNETHVLEYQGYGKRFIVSHNCSPDAFVQMAIFCAYYKLYGEVVCQYEPVLTKKYLHGRTEACRSASPEAVQFAKTFCSTSSNQSKARALRKAVKAHSAQTRLCASGRGVDRHLYALLCMQNQQRKEAERKLAEEMNTGVEGVEQRASVILRAQLNDVTPSLFDTKGWRRLNHTVLSTSNCGNPSLRLFGFGPVVADGFGIGYIIKDEGIQFCASSKHRQTERYLQMLEGFLFEMQAILEEVKAMETNPELASLGVKPREDEPAMRTHKPQMRHSKTKGKTQRRLSTGFGFFDTGLGDF